MRLFTVLLIMLICSACGKTGDLYLPDEGVPPEEPPTEAATPAEK